MAKKKFDPQAKAKRQKVILAVGGVLLLGLLAFQVPRTMKMLNPPSTNDSAPAPTSTTAGSSSGSPLAPPSTDGGGGVPSGGGGSAGGDGLADPNAQLAANAGQLVTFDRFRSKDPFSPQLDKCSGSDACAGKKPPAPAPLPPTGPGTPPGGGGTTNPPPPPPASVTRATIAVNGLEESVSVGNPFPAVDPVFVLVSLTAKAAKISIEGGSYESGAQTVTLKKGEPLTLVNTADGTRYVLKLVATS